MPTSYTAPIYEGKEITFEQFMLRCARAFGGQIELRDVSLDVEPTEENIGKDMERKYAQLQELVDERARLISMTPTEVQYAYAEETRKCRERANDAAIRQSEILERYNAMLEQVYDWTPPSEQHVEFKTWIVDQLRNSIKHDTGHDWTFPGLPPREVWHEQRIQKAQENVLWAREDVARAEESNEKNRLWLRQLRESLASGPVAA